MGYVFTIIHFPPKGTFDEFPALQDRSHGEFLLLDPGFSNIHLGKISFWSSEKCPNSLTRKPEAALQVWKPCREENGNDLAHFHIATFCTCKSYVYRFVLNEDSLVLFLSFFCLCAGIFPQIWNYYFNHAIVNVISVRHENWITVLYFISDLLHAVTSHRWATTLKPLTAEGNNIHPLVTMQCSAGRKKKKPWVLALLPMIFFWQTPKKNTTAHKAHPLTAPALLRGNATKSPRHSTELAIPQIPIRSSICVTCWNKSNPRRPGQVRAVTGEAGNLQNIKQVVVMSWLIGVNHSHIFLLFMSCLTAIALWRKHLFWNAWAWVIFTHH